MKSELIKKEEEEEFFPILKIDRIKESIVVLFTSEKEGTTVWVKDLSSSHSFPGEHKDNWISSKDNSKWETFKGEIKLSN